MDNNSQAASSQGYQTLGKKVLWLFFLQFSPVALVFFLISVGLLALSAQPFLADTLWGDIQTYVAIAAIIALIIFLVALATSFIVAKLIYENYVFLMAEDSFKIKRGVLNKTENAIPYRQIQNVDIERDIVFQALGLSRLIILTAGHEDETVKNRYEAEGVISAVDYKLAEWLQTELLRRADIQKTVEIDRGQSPISLK